MEKIIAPWTQEQVEALNSFQTAGYVHPFTWDRGPDGSETVLIATLEGWVAVEGGPVVQNWAWDFMTRDSWKIPGFRQE